MTKLATAFALAIAALVSGTSVAMAASAPIIVQRSTEVYASGKTRTIECAVSVDAVVITREFDGITSVEEKSYKLTGSIDAKMDDVAATKAVVKKASPADFSYSMTAYRSTGEALILSQFDGVKGEDTYNASSGAGVLRAVLNSVCNK